MVAGAKLLDVQVDHFIALDLNRRSDFLWQVLVRGRCSDSFFKLLHRPAPVSSAFFLFRRASSEAMLSSTASNAGGTPKIMPCIAL